MWNMLKKYVYFCEKINIHHFNSYELEKVADLKV